MRPELFVSLKSSFDSYRVSYIFTYGIAKSQSVLGKVFASDYSAPTPANLKQAMIDFANAYNQVNLQTMSNQPATQAAAALDGLVLTPGM